MLSDGRLVYISPELHTAFVELSEIKRLGFAAAHATRDLLAAWDAAPSDPAEAIATVLEHLKCGGPCERASDAHYARHQAISVLAALGVSSPHAANTDTT